MNHSRQIDTTVLSVAGFDPSGGAGVLADVKTFEANGVYGFGVVSALTVQNDREFDSVQWVDTELILQQLDALLRRFDIRHIKIGLIKDAATLRAVADHLHERIDRPTIVFDPILSASAGFVFHEGLTVADIAKGLSLLTPNIPEAQRLFGADAMEEKLMNWSHTLPVYLKGGHSDADNVTDLLFYQGQTHRFCAQRLPQGAKHGSGCVLSAAVTAQLAQRKGLAAAAQEAFSYTGRFLASTDALLGYHFNQVVYEEH